MPGTESLEASYEWTQKLQAGTVSSLEDLAHKRQVTLLSYQQEDALTARRKGLGGRCVHCGQHIEPARIDVLPWVTTCCNCARNATDGKRAWSVSRTGR